MTDVAATDDPAITVGGQQDPAKVAAAVGIVVRTRKLPRLVATGAKALYQAALPLRPAHTSLFNVRLSSQAYVSLLLACRGLVGEPPSPAELVFWPIVEAGMHSRVVTLRLAEYPKRILRARSEAAVDRLAVSCTSLFPSQRARSLRLDRTTWLLSTTRTARLSRTRSRPARLKRARVLRRLVSL